MCKKPQGHDQQALQYSGTLPKYLVYRSCPSMRAVGSSLWTSFCRCMLWPGTINILWVDSWFDTTFDWRPYVLNFDHGKTQLVSVLKRSLSFASQIWDSTEQVQGSWWQPTGCLQYSFGGPALVPERILSLCMHSPWMYIAAIQWTNTVFRKKWVVCFKIQYKFDIS